MFVRLIAVGMLALAAGHSLPAAAVGLDMPVRASLQHLPLRTLLTRVGSSTGTLLVLDRQIDPTQPVSLTARGEPLHEVLKKIADLAAVDVAVLDSSVWLVPLGEAGRYEEADRLRQTMLARLPKFSRTALSHQATWQWDAGTTPHALVNELIADASQHQLTLSLPDLNTAIPHDHLPAASLPPLTLAERFELVAMQYGRRIEWSPSRRGQQVTGRLVPLPAASTTRSPRPAGRPTIRQPRQPVATVQPLFTLRATAPLATLIDTVASQFNLEPAIDREALRRQGINPQTIVQLEVTDANRDELLTAIVSPLDLTWSISGTRLTVTTGPATETVRP